VQRAPAKDGGLSFGWFTSIEASTDRATTNSSQFGPIISFEADKVSVTANPFFEKTFGRNRDEGIALNYGWNAKYKLNDQLSIGAEGFGLIENLGDLPAASAEQHRLGPALFATIKLAEDLSITPDIGPAFWTDGGDTQADLEIQRRCAAVATRSGQIATIPLTVAAPARQVAPRAPSVRSRFRFARLKLTCVPGAARRC
jgi:hypothetical protein